MKLSEQYTHIKGLMQNVKRTKKHCFWYICNAINYPTFLDNKLLLLDFESRMFEAKKFSKKHNIKFTGNTNKGTKCQWWAFDQAEIRLLFLDHIIQELESQGL